MNIQADNVNRSARVENRHGACTKAAEKHGVEWERIRKERCPRVSRTSVFPLKVARNNSQTTACVAGAKGGFTPSNFYGGKGTLHRRIMDFPARDDPPLSTRVEQARDFPQAPLEKSSANFYPPPSRRLSKRDTRIAPIVPVTL